MSRTYDVIDPEDLFEDTWELEDDHELNLFDEGGDPGDLFDEDGSFAMGGEPDMETPVGMPELFDEDSSWDGEGDYLDEDDEFFRKVGRFVKRAARKVGGAVRKGIRAIGKFAGPLLKVLGPVAAKVVGAAIGGPAGAAIAGTLASALLREAELEDEGDAESAVEEDEALLAGIGVDEDEYDLMASAAIDLSEAEDEDEGDEALTRVIGHGVRAFRASPRLKPYLPRVMQAAVALSRTFAGNPRTRWAVQVVPLIVSRTLLRLSRVPDITPRALVLAMAHETAWALASPARARAALRTVRRRGARARSRGVGRRRTAASRRRRPPPRRR